MKTTLIRPIGKRNQITIPVQLLKGLRLHPGDFVGFSSDREGILLKPVEVVEKEEAWRQEDLDAMEKQFTEQTGKKEYVRFADSQSALKYLKKLSQKK